MVVQTYVPEPVVVAPRIDVDWAAEVAKARMTRAPRRRVGSPWRRRTVIWAYQSINNGAINFNEIRVATVAAARRRERSGWQLR